MLSTVKDRVIIVNIQRLNTLRLRYYNLPVGLRAAFWFAVCSILQSGISVLTTPIFTRLLSTDEFGQYSVFQSWNGIISIFVSMRLTAGVYTQGLIKFDKERTIYSSSLQGLTLTLCAFWTVVYLLCPEFWNAITKLTKFQMLEMIALIWSSAAFGFWAVEQRVNYKYQVLIIVSLAMAVLSPMTSILLVWHSQDKVTARITGMTLVSVMSGVWLFAQQMNRGRVFFHERFWRYALGFNLPLIPHYISQTILSSADRIMIRDLTSASDAGIYSIAYSVSMLMTIFNSAIMQTMDPWMYQRIKDKNIKDIKNVAYPALIFISAANLFLMAFAPEVIRIFAPPAYYDAIWVIPPVAMSVVFTFSYDLFAKFEFYYEKTKFIMMASIAGALANVALNYVFIPIYGYRAAAYTTLFCYILYALGHYLFMRKVCKDYLDGEEPYAPRVLLGIYGAFMVAGFLFLFFYSYATIRYGLILVCIIVLVIFRRIIMSTFEMFLNLRKSKK